MRANALTLAATLIACGADKASAPVASAGWSETLPADHVSGVRFVFEGGLPQLGAAGPATIALHGPQASVTSEDLVAVASIDAAGCTWKPFATTFPDGHPLASLEPVELAGCAVQLAATRPPAADAESVVEAQLRLGDAISAPISIAFVSGAPKLSPSTPPWPDVDLAGPPVFDWANLRPGPPMDYWALVEEGIGHMRRTLAASGSPCGSATDRAACQAALAALRSEAGFSYGCHPSACWRYLVSTSGNEVHVWTTRADVREFLGTVDSAEDADLLLFASGIYTTAIAPSRDGYQALATQVLGACPTTMLRLLVFVARDGTITILRAQDVLERGGLCA